MWLVLDFKDKTIFDITKIKIRLFLFFCFRILFYICVLNQSTMAKTQTWIFFYEGEDFTKYKVSERECKKPERTKNWNETRECIKIPFRSFGAMIKEDFEQYDYKEHVR